VTNGSLTTPVTITNSGFGYTQTNPPQVLTPTTNVSYENITDMTAVAGFAGTITGIGTTTGTGSNPLAIKFTLGAPDFSTLSEGYPIYIFNTTTGDGVVSINGSDTSTVGIGTTFLDNVYIVNSLHNGGTVGVITCNILSTTDTSVIEELSGSLTNPLGHFSWGRLFGFTRSSSPVSIGVTGLTVDSGLSTFPTIQRRGIGLRDNGALRKEL